MGNREKLRIELAERSYDIWIGANLIQDSAEIILSLIRSNHIIIVTDKNIANYWLKPLCVALHSKKIRVNDITLFHLPTFIPKIIMFIINIILLNHIIIKIY